MACGALLPRRTRRYCSRDCKEQINWVLGLSKGLLRTFNTRYAVFFFTSNLVILDMLPSWSQYVSRFFCNRTPGCKPAQDLKKLILNSGEEWHHLLYKRHSKSRASFELVTRNHRKDLDPSYLKPIVRVRPRLTKKERSYLKVLNLEEKDLFSSSLEELLKKAFKKMAKVYHPDAGGDNESFKLLMEAHHYITHWCERPQFYQKKVLADYWSYDGLTNRWSPPMP